MLRTFKTNGKSLRSSSTTDSIVKCYRRRMMYNVQWTPTSPESSQVSGQLWIKLHLLQGLMLPDQNVLCLTYMCVINMFWGRVVQVHACAEKPRENDLTEENHDQTAPTHTQTIIARLSVLDMLVLLPPSITTLSCFLESQLNRVNWWFLHER